MIDGLIALLALLAVLALYRLLALGAPYGDEEGVPADPEAQQPDVNAAA